MNNITMIKDNDPVEIRFYTIADLQKMLGWSETTMQKLFKDPNFPSSDFARARSSKRMRSSTTSQRSM